MEAKILITCLMYIFRLYFVLVNHKSISTMSVLKPVGKSVTYQRADIPNVLQYANQKRNNGSFNDVTIEAGDRTIAANRMILSCCSRFFEAMFDLEMKEKYQNPVQIHGVDGAAVKSVVDFMYSREVKITSENVMELIAASDYLQVTEVKRFCFEFLESILSLNNWFTILNAAKLYKSEHLLDQVYEYVGKNFNDAVQTDEFNLLVKHDLVGLISNSNRNHIKEVLIFEGLVTWCRHDEAARKDEFLAMYEELVDLAKISSNELKGIVLKEKLISENHYHRLKVVENILAQERKLCGNTKVVSLGGHKTPHKSIEVLNLTNKSQQTFPDMPMGLDSHCSLKSGNFVYLIGGCTPAKDGKIIVSQNVWCLNTTDEELIWKEVAPMNQKRYVMGGAVFRDSLVVAAGCNKNHKVLSSVEYYQAAFDEWKFASPLRNARSGCAMVASNEHLYVLGGWVDDKCSSSVERISKLSEDWEEIQSMQMPRRWLASVICNGIIYAIGGQTDCKEKITTSTVETYNFGENKWVYVSSMITERSAHAACVMNGKIYVVGGLDASNKTVKSIECYDPETDSWSVVGNIDVSLYHHSLIVL